MRKKAYQSSERKPYTESQNRNLSNIKCENKLGIFSNVRPEFHRILDSFKGELKQNHQIRSDCNMRIDSNHQKDFPYIFQILNIFFLNVTLKYLYFAFVLGAVKPQYCNTVCSAYHTLPVCAKSHIIVYVRQYNNNVYTHLSTIIRLAFVESLKNSWRSYSS